MDISTDSDPELTKDNHSNQNTDQRDGDVMAPLANDFKEPQLPVVPSNAVEKDEKSQPASKSTAKSSAESKKNAPALQYKEPSWSGVCSQVYTLEIIKNGVPVDEVKLSSKPFWVVGRLAQCDLPMEHPSLSRYHAVIQYCAVPSDKHPVGWYLYDLGSTHGTTLNKQRLSSLTYHRLRVGYTFKFGGSTRLHIIQGPDEDQETEITPDELTALREKRKAQLEEKLRLRAEAKDAQLAKDSTEDGGCSWGIDDDAEDVDPEAVNPFASDIITEELHLDDPKKTLRGWFEREGYDEPEYILEEQSHGRFRCTVDLPVDTPTGHPLKAEISVQGKKKEAVVQCAMEACRILDKQGVLRQAKHESRKRKVKNWGDNDYYDSEDDTFLDRTGDVEKKRQLRMKRAGKLEEEKKQAALTYNQLVEQLTAIESEVTDIQDKLDRTKKLEKERAEDMDDLDAYMLSIKSGGMNATEKTKCKRRMIELKHDKARMEKLINIAKPNSLQELRKTMQAKAPQPQSISKTQPPPRKEDKDDNIKLDNDSSIEPRSRNNANTSLAQDASNDVKPIHSVPDIASNVKHVNSDSLIERNSKNVKHTSKATNSSAVDSRPETTHSSTVDSSSETTHSPTVDSSPAETAKKSKKKKRKLSESSDQAPEKTSQTSNKTMQAPVGSSLAGMVSNLKTKAEQEELMKDPDYASWLPPKDQSGDGRTSLNDKFGY